MKKSEEKIKNCEKQINDIDFTEKKVSIESIVFSKPFLNLYVEKGEDKNFELSIKEFNSKKVLIVGEGFVPQALKYVATPMYLEGVLVQIKLKKEKGADFKITLTRKDTC